MKTTKKKINTGIGIVVCDRLGNFRTLVKSLESTPRKEEILFAVSDDSRHSTEEISKILKESSLNWEHIISGKKQVGATKNLLFKRFLEEETLEHMFILEDDVVIKNINVFNKYIELAKESKIEHLSFTPIEMMLGERHIVVTWKKGSEQITKVKFDVNAHGVFTYYTRQCIEDAGLFDERFVNAWEHVDHSWGIFKTYKNKGKFIGDFWYFPDLPESNNYLALSNEEGSYIINNTDANQHKEKGGYLFLEKNEVAPADITERMMIDVLREYTTYLVSDMDEHEKSLVTMDIEEYNKYLK